MGKSVTPTYRIEIPSAVCVTRGVRVGHSPAGWSVKHSGSPTDESLAKYVADYEASTLPGGVNEHLGVTRVSSARVVHQSSGEVVATYAPAMFTVLAASSRAQVALDKAADDYAAKKTA